MEKLSGSIWTWWEVVLQTSKEILRREEERQNLRNIGLCILTILVLVVVSFMMVSLDFVFEAGRSDANNWVSSTEVAP